MLPGIKQTTKPSVTCGPSVIARISTPCTGGSTMSFCSWRRRSASRWASAARDRISALSIPESYSLSVRIPQMRTPPLEFAKELRFSLHSLFTSSARLPCSFARGRPLSLSGDGSGASMKAASLKSIHSFSSIFSCTSAESCAKAAAGSSGSLRKKTSA